MKLVQAARLSKAKDASTSVEKQDEEMQRWAAANGHEIVATTTDTDVSGGVSPFKRPGLGPWLTDPAKIASYDGILAAHIDRLGRSTHDFVDLLRWADDTCGKCPPKKIADDHRKTIITSALGDTVDFSQGVGKLIGFVLMWLAEEELKAIKRRTTGTFAWLRDNGYLTGKPPFGYVIAVKDNHKTIVPDPAMYRVGRHILAVAADKYISGWTLTRVCGWLDAEGFSPSQGKRWSPTSLRQLFENPVLIGRLKSAGREVTGKDGLKLQRCEPILTSAEWKILQERIASNPTKRLPEISGPLVRVAYCLKCQGPLYRRVNRRKGRNGQEYENVYYRCSGTQREPSKCANMLREEHLAETIEYDMLRRYGHLKLTRRVLIEGNGIAEKIAEVSEALTELEDDRYVRGLYRSADGAERFAARYSALEDELAALRSQEAIEDRWEEVETGETVASRWATLDWGAKGAFMREAGLLAYCVNLGKGNVAAMLMMPNEEHAVSLLTVA